MHFEQLEQNETTHYNEESRMFGARHYPSPHQSPELDIGKQVMGEARWGSGSPSPVYQMTSPASQWGSLKPQQQRPSPSPSLHSQMGDYSFSPESTSSFGGDYQDHSYTLGLMQNAPLTPPVSDEFVSPDLSQQDPSQWGSQAYGVKNETANSLQILDALGMDDYSLMPGGSLRIQEPTPPLETRRSLGGLFPDVSGGQMVRKKRRLTEPGEANYHCSICGKYFSRVWNYNAHRETHDPSRPKPHVCQAEGCGKAFVRRTDLTRHIQCVHAKDKKFQCSLCNNRFARKDTLRRHEDDGCPKRVDIQSRNPKGPAAPIAWTSWALRCPPPPDYFNFTAGAGAPPLPSMYEPAVSSNASSFLPPLSVALSNGHGPQLQVNHTQCF